MMANYFRLISAPPAWLQIGGEDLVVGGFTGLG